MILLLNVLYCHDSNELNWFNNEINFNNNINIGFYSVNRNVFDKNIESFKIFEYFFKKIEIENVWLVDYNAIESFSNLKIDPLAQNNELIIFKYLFYFKFNQILLKIKFKLKKNKEEMISLEVIQFLKMKISKRLN
jgi:hypothetical protein